MSVRENLIDNGSVQSELSAALRACRGAFVVVGLLSGIINVLMLTGAFFMLQVYDRVLISGSVPTLIALSGLVIFLFLMMGLLDLIRSRMLIRIGDSLDDDLGGRTFRSLLKVPLLVGHNDEGLQPLRDLDSIRTFLAGPGPTALFDMPWMPIYMAIIFIFHPLLGTTAIIGAIVLVSLTLLTEFLIRAPSKEVTRYLQARNNLAETGLRNAEAVTAMGMANKLHLRWEAANKQYMALQKKISDITSGLGSISKALRMLLQSAMLGMGAFLVINEQATAGIIIAGAILVGRALAPVDLAISQWRGFVGARQSWRRLSQLLKFLPPQTQPLALPAPQKMLSVEALSASPPGSDHPVLRDINMHLTAGNAVAVIGPSASGKSSLARLLVGAWKPRVGLVNLDGASLDQWDREELGKHIG